MGDDTLVSYEYHYGVNFGQVLKIAYFRHKTPQSSDQNLMYVLINIQFVPFALINIFLKFPSLFLNENKFIFSRWILTSSQRPYSPWYNIFEFRDHLTHQKNGHYLHLFYWIILVQFIKSAGDLNLFDPKISEGVYPAIFTDMMRIRNVYADLSSKRVSIKRWKFSLFPIKCFSPWPCTCEFCNWVQRRVGSRGRC